MPRSYRLGRRAEQVAATRARIIGAAIALYAEHGVSRTTMQEVARRADVAPGTVLNHFPTPDDLAMAAAERIVDDLRVPEPALLDGIDDPHDRLVRLSHELATFYERGESWWQIYQREPGPIPAWAAVETRVAEQLEAFLSAGLGSNADDAVAGAVLAAIASPGVFWTLRSRGLSSSDAADVIADLIAPWLTARADQAGLRPTARARRRVTRPRP